MALRGGTAAGEAAEATGGGEAEATGEEGGAFSHPGPSTVTELKAVRVTELDTRLN